MLVKLRNAFTVMVAFDGFGEKIGNVEEDQLLGSLDPFGRDRIGVGDDNEIDALAVFHHLERVVAEEAVGGHAVNFLRATHLDHGFGCGDPRSTLVDHVVDDQDHLVSDIPDQGDGVLELRVLELFLLRVGCSARIERAPERMIGRVVGEEGCSHEVSIEELRSTKRIWWNCRD